MTASEVIEMMERTLDERPKRAGAAAAPRPTDRTASSLLGEVLATWPTAPVSEVGGTGRWLTFARPGGGTVYLQRYAWDDRTVPHYLVVVPTGPDRAEQHRCSALGEAIQKVRRLLVCGPVPRRSGLLGDVVDVPGLTGRQPDAASAA
jgi:hypothetical protein